MFSFAGKVPFGATCSQTPFVEIRASVGAGRSEQVVAVGDVGVVRDGVGGMPGVVEPGVRRGLRDHARRGRRPGVGDRAGRRRARRCRSLVGPARPAAASGRCAAAGAAVVESCWTNGSLLLKRPNEISWFVSRWTATRSVSGSLPAGRPAQAAARPASRTRSSPARRRAPRCLCRRSASGSSKPRTASRTTRARQR